MINQIIKNLFLVSLFFTFSLVTYGQNFEGSITYKLETQNPNPEMISEEDFQKMLKETFGERGYIVQNYFYKGSNYISEMDVGKEVGFMAYNSEDGLLYSWQKDAETAVTLDSKKFMDEFVEILESEETETILDILCSSIIVKSKFGEMKIWYNKDQFKMDPKLYEEHKYGHWNEILKRIECLPLKIEQKGLMGQLTQTAIEFKAEAVEDSKFAIPKFKEVTANPMN